MKTWTALASTAFISASLLGSLCVGAEGADLEDLRSRVEKLEAAQVEKVTPSPAEEEITKLKLDMQLPDELGKSFTGLGPGASHVYFSKSPLAIGGYGEILYTAQSDGTRLTDIARANVSLGYRFSQNLVFNSSAGTDGIQYLYMDFLINETTGVRVGNLLIPFGITNLRFEPTLFLSVNRPRPEVSIIPSTWHENGILVFGNVGNFTLQGGFVDGGDASLYHADSWIRDGRQGGTNAKAASGAWVLRAEQLYDDSSLGASFYIGDSAQGDARLDRAQVILGEAHGEFRADRISGKLLYTEGHLSNTDRIYALTGQAVGSQVRGGYIELSYDLLPRLSNVAKHYREKPLPPNWREMPIFVQWQRDDLQANATDGQPTHGAAPADGSLRTDIFTFGLNYKPHPQVVIKTDLAMRSTNAGQTDRVVEGALGFVF